MPNINASYQWVIQKCNDPNVRYSMDVNKRNGVIIDGLQYYDCSSLMFWALDAGGFPVVSIYGNSAFTTYDMGPVLLQLGFVTVSRTGQLLPADIGVHHRGSAGGHTEMCYRGGSGQGYFMGAHGSSLAPANQVSINDYNTQGTYWDEIYRYGGGASGDEVSIYVIAAICGNFFAESGVNPAIWESLVVRPWDGMYYQNTGGYGLGQWTNTSSTNMRLLNLHNWVNQNGYADGDGYGQLGFLLHENYWTPTSIEQSAYNSLTDFLHSTSTDINTLTREYMFHWEGINNGTLSTRQQFAQDAYNYIVAHFDDSSINTWVSGNNYISQNDALNNCVLIARYLSTGVAPFSSAFKIWMAKQHWIRKRRLRY